MASLTDPGSYYWVLLQTTVEFIFAGEVRYRIKGTDRSVQWHMVWIGGRKEADGLTWWSGRKWPKPKPETATRENSAGHLTNSLTQDLEHPLTRRGATVTAQLSSDPQEEDRIITDKPCRSNRVAW